MRLKSKPLAKAVDLEQTIINQALYTAIIGDNLDEVRNQINSGAQLNVNSNKNTSPPLNTASWRGRREIVELLIKRGADVNLNKDVVYNEMDAGDIGRYGNALITAISNSRPEIVEILLLSGADPGTKDGHANTSLMIAVNEAQSSGSLEMVKILLDNGADINAHSETGYTVLMHAIHRGNQEIIEHLLKNGANLENSQSYDYSIFDVVPHKKELLKFIEDYLLNKAANQDLDPKAETNALPSRRLRV